MASIIDRAFDASKKIVRAVFRGAPNLFTTSDINRQFEAIKAQLDFLEDKVGCVNTSNVDITATISGTTLTVQVKAGGGGNMEFYVRGIKHTTTSFPALTKTSIGKSGVCYLVMRATTKLVEFSDAQYDISGAEFSDSTYQPAADHLVYDTFSISLESSNILPAGAVGVLAKISWEGTTTYVRPYYKNSVYTNGIHSDSGLFAMAQNKVESFSPTETTTPGINVNYDRVLAYLARTIVPQKAILPFYGDISTPPAYGWIPCGYIAYVSYTGATVASFASNATYKAYIALYGDANIKFAVQVVGNYTYLRISRCLTVDIPDLSGKFLAGGVPLSGYVDADKKLFVPKFGTEGGEAWHTLTNAEMPNHSHSMAETGSHTHNLNAAYRNDGSGNHGWLDEVDPNGSNTHDFATKSAGAHTHIIYGSGGGDEHENRPPYLATYYIMRVI